MDTVYMHVEMYIECKHICGYMNFVCEYEPLNVYKVWTYIYISGNLLNGFGVCHRHLSVASRAQRERKCNGEGQKQTWRLKCVYWL